MLRALLLIWLAGAGVAAPIVTKVEPPNWWPDHTINPIRLLIHGSGFAGAEVKAAPGFAASDTWVNPAGTYLLCDLRIPAGAPPGSYPLEIQTPDGSVSANFRVDAPLPTDGRFSGFSPDDVIYLIMVDPSPMGMIQTTIRPFLTGCLTGRIAICIMAATFRASSIICPI